MTKSNLDFLNIVSPTETLPASCPIWVIGVSHSTLKNSVRCKFKLNLDILNYAKVIKDNWDGIYLITPVS